MLRVAEVVDVVILVEVREVFGVYKVDEVVEEDKVVEMAEVVKEVVFLFIPRILIYFISLLYNYNNSSRNSIILPILAETIFFKENYRSLLQSFTQKIKNRRILKIIEIPFPNLQELTVFQLNMIKFRRLFSELSW
jgi:hypothetical protein